MLLNKLLAVNLNVYQKKTWPVSFIIKDFRAILLKAVKICLCYDVKMQPSYNLLSLGTSPARRRAATPKRFSLLLPQFLFFCFDFFTTSLPLSTNHSVKNSRSLH